MKNKSMRIQAILLAVITIIALSICHPIIGSGAETAGSEADTTGKKVYFAGPLFNDAEKDYNLKIVTILESYGYEVFLPQRDGFLAPEIGEMTEEEKTMMREPVLSLASVIRPARYATGSRTTPGRQNSAWISIP